MDYPIILLPPLLQEVETHGFKPKPPQKPTFDEEKPEYRDPTNGCLYIISACGLMLGILMLVGSIYSLISQKGDMAEVLIPLLIFDLIAGFIVAEGRAQAKSYPQKYKSQLNSWKSKKEKYKKDLQLYYKEKSQYETDIERVPSMSKKELVKEGLKRFYKKNVEQPKFANFDVKKGKTEHILFEFLNNLLDDKIKINQTIIVGDYFSEDRKPYIPDMIYHNEESKICIDIEIDEKYERDNYEPIHYINLKSDEKRNNFFLLRSWIVIRFTENQVEKDIDGCAVSLLNVILKYDPCFTLDQPQYEFYWKNNTVTPEPRWTYADVLEELP